MKKITGSSFFSGWMVFSALLAIALLYFSFLPVNYSFDGTVFSHFLRYALLKGDWLAVTQIHHLLYFPLNYMIYRALEALCSYHVLEFFHLQLFSLFFGILTLAAIERMLKRLNLALLLRLLAVAIVAFSFNFWLYAVDAEVNVPGLFFIVAGLAILVFLKAGTRTLVGAALCFALAAGFHLTNVLIAASAFFFLLWQRRPWRHFIQFYFAYAAFLVLPYALYAVLSKKPVFLTLANVFFAPDTYSGYRSTLFMPLTGSTVATSFASIKHALVADSRPWSWLVFAVLLVLLGLAWKQRNDAENKAFRMAMLFWFIPFFVFFTFWNSAIVEFKIHAIVPLLLIAVSALAKLRPTVAGALASALAAGLLLINFYSGILPLNDSGRNTDHQVALAIGEATPKNAQILITGNFEGYGYGKIYLPYFALREVLILDWMLGRGQSLEAIRGRLRQTAAAGRPLYALGEIAEKDRSMRSLLNFHRIPEKESRNFYATTRFIKVADLPGGHRLYRLECATP